MKIIIFSIALFASTFCFGDAPLPPPEGKRFCDIWMNYCGYTDPVSGTDVYKVEGSFQLNKIYSVKGWHRAPFLSFDGVFFVSSYGGLNLIPIGAKPTLTMLSIFKNGKLHKEITLSEIIKNMSSLKRTASHFHWGGISSVNNNYITLNTVEGRVLVVLESGLVEHAK